VIDEPSAANNVLGLRDGAIVDVGGGTTGVAILQHGKVVYTADEATGGTHFTLVIAGSLDLPFDEAEKLKTNPAEQARLFPLIRPVMEKVAAITTRHIRGWSVPSITLVGGTSAFPGMADVVEAYTGIRTTVAPHPMFVTPLGIALQDTG
jgi:ethanolamine utilization protein EutJ